MLKQLHEMAAPSSIVSLLSISLSISLSLSLYLYLSLLRAKMSDDDAFKSGQKPIEKKTRWRVTLEATQKKQKKEVHPSFLISPGGSLGDRGIHRLCW